MGAIDQQPQHHPTKHSDPGETGTVTMEVRSIRNFRRRLRQRLKKSSSRKMGAINQQPQHHPTKHSDPGETGTVTMEVPKSTTNDLSQLNATFYERRRWISERHPQICEVMEKFPALHTVEFVSS